LSDGDDGGSFGGVVGCGCGVGGVDDNVDGENKVADEFDHGRCRNCAGLFHNVIDVWVQAIALVKQLI
jgi:hypothetical protein